jgi:hypothetical protein
MTKDLPQNIELENILIQLQELHCDSKIGKSRHFIAADRKVLYNKLVGLTIILINVLIGSTLITTIKDDSLKSTFISIAAFIAASFAAIQTFFNYSKDIENHRKIGNLYLEIVRDSDNIISKYKDKFIDKDSCQKEYERLLEKYKNINKEEEICPNSNRDYRKAYKKNKDAKDRIRKLKKEVLYSV